MRLSSSGHRAISTLHTNSVCEVPNRFFLFRAQPFMVAIASKSRAVQEAAAGTISLEEACKFREVDLRRLVDAGE
jgi:type II secretory ATPase GspE/PulE/Tfp pilus assembly ATPase PilB-like protein